MRFASFLFFFLLLHLIVNQACYAHPQDEDIILDIEQGELNLDSNKRLSEREQAQKRRDQRRLNALPWHKKAQRYVVAGIEHIVPKGLDHILFVIGIFFSTPLLKPLIWQISAFTVAHTATLAAAIMGWIVVPASIVEPLIALSIAYIAIENIWRQKPSRYRPLIIFVFGLLHGLGFASVLTDIGLPSNALITALVAFNIGVELGQLLVIAACFLLFVWFIKSARYRSHIQIPASLVIGLFGAYWFVERVINFA